MAQEIRTTPIVSGKDAENFEKQIKKNSEQGSIVPDFEAKKEAYEKIIAKSNK